jgi:REP element-mobilizing transposase RayT
MGHPVYTEIIMKMKGKSKYNPRIHHRRSIRLKGYDYSQAGWYFITICCQGRICRFGHIENGEIILNEYGKIARDEWMRTTEIRPNVELGEFVIMPNHLHGIIQINYRRGELHSPPKHKRIAFAPKHKRIAFAPKHKRIAPKHKRMAFAQHGR